MADETEPDIESVQQEEYTGELPIPDVPVKVCGPVRVQQLPSVAAAPRSIAVDNTGPVKVLSIEPRRRRAVLVCTEDTYLGGAQSDAGTGTGSALAFWPKSTPLELFHGDELWIGLATAPSARITIIEELWTG